MGGVMFNDQEIKELEEIRNKFLEEKAPKQIKEVIETISIELSEIESEMKKPIEIEGTTFDDDVFEELRKELEGEDN
jgi:O6-methylguanine-DNA--protein-cysteine methyltransferase